MDCAIHRVLETRASNSSKHAIVINISKFSNFLKYKLQFEWDAFDFEKKSETIRPQVPTFDLAFFHYELYPSVYVKK